MPGGKGSTKWLTPDEQEALTTASIILIDSLFDQWSQVKVWKPESILATRLGKYLPTQYLPNYTPLHLKQFGVCVIMVAWKFAQPKPLPLASVAEQLATWAILQEAKEILMQVSTDESRRRVVQPFQAFLDGYVEDTRFLCLFGDQQRETHSTEKKSNLTSLTFENWFQPFSHAHISLPHPYAFDGEAVGQAYKEQLSPFEREALDAGISMLIDEIFDDFTQEENRELEDMAGTTLLWHLPSHYLPKYAPLFLKQFTVCVIIVSWKLAQSKPLVLSSIAEELAAYAIINTAQRYIELEMEEKGKGKSQQNAAYALDHFLEVLFEDTDFTLLFDDQFDGIETSMIGQMLHMTSLAFKDWFTPFSDDPARIAHPYVFPNKVEI